MDDPPRAVASPHRRPDSRPSLRPQIDEPEDVHARTHRRVRGRARSADHKWRLRGRREAGLTVFRGVRYAEPPVGALRFGAPAPAARWTGVRDAVSFGPPPPQAGLFGNDPTDAGDDWLTLNVWSPDPGVGVGLPVLVWIPGGAYAIGTSSLPEYDGARLAGGGAVVVTVNYRLGVEGFLQIAGAPANRGLLDQIAALQWVRDNIRHFGGDPDQVTVFGESAGGGSVAALLAMPPAAGLFRRAIVQSMPGTFFSSALADDLAAAIAAEVGRQPTATELASVPPAQLPAVAGQVSAKITAWADRWGPIAYRPILFAPVVDGEVLPQTPWAALSAGVGKDVDLLVGHTRDEHRLFSLIDGVLGQVDDDRAAAALTALAPDPHRYRSAYPAASAETLYELVNGDWLFRMPSLRLAEAHTGNTFLYELVWPAPGLGGMLGACHGLDVPLVFGNLSSGSPAMLIGDNPSDAEPLSAQMRSAWPSFAASGSPGWPAFTNQDRLTRLFGGHPELAPYPEQTSRMLWQDHDFAALSLRA